MMPGEGDGQIHLLLAERLEGLGSFEFFTLKGLLTCLLTPAHQAPSPS